MQIVIDIPEDVYKDIQSHDWKNGGRWFSEEWKAIHNGTPLPEDYRQMAEELKRHRKAWSKLKNDIVAYHNNYDYDTAMHFLNTVVGLCTDIYDDTDAGGDAE